MTDKERKGDEVEVEIVVCLSRAAGIAKTLIVVAYEFDIDAEETV
jgi:hypothetical protein